jgi:hypothetical protein
MQVNEAVTRATPVHINKISLVVSFMEALLGFESFSNLLQYKFLQPEVTDIPVLLNDISEINYIRTKQFIQLPLKDFN